MQTKPKFNGFTHLLKSHTLQMPETIFWTPTPRFIYLANIQVSMTTESIFWRPSLRFCYQNVQLQPIEKNVFWQS